MIHRQMSAMERQVITDHAPGAKFDRPEMMCRTGDGNAVGSEDWGKVTCPRCRDTRRRPAETAPKDGTVVVLFIPDYGVGPEIHEARAVWDAEHEDWVDADDRDAHLYAPTGWRPDE